MAAKLENLLGQIDMWCAANARAELRQLIFLGDYIDRGPDSRRVLQIVQHLQAEGAICLRGNHEELMLRATESERDLANFLANGGDATITSLRTPAAFQRAQEWVRALPTSHEDELRYYIHAGIRPGVPLDQQTAEAKLWIRDSFLRHRGPFPKYIVHGHTPTMALSRCQRNARILRLEHFQATVTAARHMSIADARKARCVLAEMRWRWTLKVLYAAAWVERNLWAEPGLLN